MHHVDAGHHLEQLARNVVASAGAGRRHVEFTGIGLGIGDEFGNRLGRNRRVHHHDVGISHDARDRRDVADEIVVELVVQRCVDRVEATDHEQRVAVSRRAHDRFGGDVAASARPILDDKLLS
jgi:hypothetical protein